jgi:phosphate:Na+ symporter
MGANIGTTVTGWIVSAGEWSKLLKPNTIAPLAIMLGVVFLLAGKKKILQELAGITIGFGLLFVGIGMMSDAVAPLKEFVGFREAFLKLGGNPLLGIVVGAVVTAVIQSSSASVGILQSLAAAGLVPFQTAVYIIMGQNIGTCITAMLSSIGTKENAKVAALMHLLFNVIGTTIFGIGAILYFTGAKPAWGTFPITQTQIGIVHTVFNVATTILLFPLSKRIIWLAKKMGSEKITPQ